MAIKIDKCHSCGRSNIKTIDNECLRCCFAIRCRDCDRRLVADELKDDLLCTDYTNAHGVVVTDPIPEVFQIEFLSGKTINPNCPECKGTGKYTGFNKIEYCRTCITGDRKHHGES